MIHINHQGLRNEVYRGTDLEIGTLELNKEDNGGIGGFEVSQNEPNPFQGSTNIELSLSNESQVVLTVHNVEGKVLLQRTRNLNAGKHVLQLRNTDLGASGVYYYTVKSGNDVVTKKMILMN